MYEQYTDEQIVEMLVPKLKKVVPELNWEEYLKHPDNYFYIWVRLISVIYKSGYIRGQLGRSFIIGQPKRTEHWVPANKDNVKVGCKVRMTNGEGHKNNPQWFPDAGIVGIVMEAGFHTHFIQWPKGSTSESDRWYCEDTRLEVLL